MMAAHTTPSPGAAPATAPAWLDTLRAAARRRFEALGWPSRRLEAWKNVNPRSLRGFGDGTAPAPSADLVTRARVAAGEARPTACGRVLIVNAHVVDLPNRSDLPRGLRVMTLAQAAAELDLAPVLGQLAPTEDAGLLALNQSLLPDAVVVHVARGAAIEQPLDLVHVTTPDGGAIPAHPRVLVIAEATSELTVVQRWLGEGAEPTLTNAVTELAVGPDATVRHVEVVAAPDAALHIGFTAARVSRGGRFESYVISLSGLLGRSEVHAELSGPGASSSFDGLYLAHGESTLDHYTRVVHAAPHTSSDEVYKGVIDDSATGGFFGRVLISEGARGSETHQLNNNLLLSRDAQAKTRPQLEIDNDDVAATHGATVGQLDEMALFYLQARGIPAETARALLTWAFASEMLRRLPDADLEASLSGVLTARLATAATAAVLAAEELAS